MSVTGFLGTTNGPSGLLKVFRVSPGATAEIGINVTDGHNEYGLALSNLGGGGANDATHHLDYSADSAWTRRSSYYSVGPSGSNRQWTFRLGVGASTPPDLYRLDLQMAGVGGGRWRQAESFYVEVAAPLPAAPQLSRPTREGTTFSCEVATESGYTYFLEARTSVGDVDWRVLSQVSGDGSLKVLVDAEATSSQSLYRVRVE